MGIQKERMVARARDNHSKDYAKIIGLHPRSGYSSAQYLLMRIVNKCHSMQITSVFTCPIISYAALIFVDDGEVPTMATSAKETTRGVIKRHQSTVTCSAGGLRVTGGTFKLENAFGIRLNGYRRKLLHILCQLTK